MSYLLDSSNQRCAINKIKTSRYTEQASVLSKDSCMTSHSFSFSFMRKHISLLKADCSAFIFITLKNAFKNRAKIKWAVTTALRMPAKTQVAGWRKPKACLLKKGWCLMWHLVSLISFWSLQSSVSTLNITHSSQSLIKQCTFNELNK